MVGSTAFDAIAQEQSKKVFSKSADSTYIINTSDGNLYILMASILRQNKFYKRFTFALFSFLR